MSQSASYPLPQRHSAYSRWLLWFGLFGGPASWSIQLLVNYSLAAHFCYPRNVPLSTPTFGGLWMTLIAVSVLMSLTALAAGAAAASIWRKTREGTSGTHESVMGSDAARVRFMAYAGMLVSGLFLFAVLMSAFPLFIVPVCSYGA